jgi:hypothetical protein
MSRQHPQPRPLGLFAAVDDDGDVIADEPSDRRNPCPVPQCHALAWEPCTRPSHRGGRVPMRGVHPSRKQDSGG